MTDRISSFGLKLLFIFVGALIGQLLASPAYGLVQMANTDVAFVVSCLIQLAVPLYVAWKVRNG